VQALLHESIVPSEGILAGDFRLITMLDQAIDMDSIKIYLAKDIDNDTFVWVIGKFVDSEKISMFPFLKGKFLDSGKITMFPLLKEQSEDLQLEIRSVLIEKGLINILTKDTP
jgi:hypothetical protein